MNRPLKTFLLWLLIAVLPLNAVAGSLGLGCAPVHHQMQAPAGIAVSDRDATAAAHAHHGAEYTAHAAENASDGKTVAKAAEQQSHGSCSACSSFCLGAAAPPSTDLALPSFDGSDAAVAAPTAFVVAFIQDGPHRPPRYPAA